MFKLKNRTQWKGAGIIATSAHPKIPQAWTTEKFSNPTPSQTEPKYVASVSTWILVIYIVTNLISYALVYHTLPFITHVVAHQIDAVIFWVRAWLIGSVFVAHHRPWPGILSVVGGPFTIIVAAPTPVLVGFIAGAGSLGFYLGMILYINSAVPYRWLETGSLLLLAAFYHSTSTLQKNSYLTITGGKELLTTEAILVAAFLGPLSSAIDGRKTLMVSLSTSPALKARV